VQINHPLRLGRKVRPGRLVAHRSGIRLRCASQLRERSAAKEVATAGKQGAAVMHHLFW